MSLAIKYVSLSRRVNAKKRELLKRVGIDSDQAVDGGQAVDSSQVIDINSDQIITDRFHTMYYYDGANTWVNTYWLGTPVYKCPLDLWIYQEIISETKPDFIIECGTARGGSALYLASICDLVNNGKIITIDIESADGKPQHDRVTYIVGSSISQETHDQLKELIPEGSKIMVILDSDHSKDHVLKELKVFNKIVTKGCYMLVEDTNLNGHPILPLYGAGPMEALEEFLESNNEFIVDMSRQKLHLTFNPKGYLKKV